MAEEAENSTLLGAEEEEEKAGTETLLTAEEGESAPAEEQEYALELDGASAADRENVDAYAKQCREMGMSREQAQASVDFSVALHERERENFVRQRQDWVGEMKQDPEFGGEKFGASCVAAKKALAAFDSSGEVRRMLNETGYGDNPAVIRVFARIGRAMAEDNFVTGRPRRAELPLEQRLYR